MYLSQRFCSWSQRGKPLQLSFTWLEVPTWPPEPQFPHLCNGDNLSPPRDCLGNDMGQSQPSGEWTPGEHWSLRKMIDRGAVRGLTAVSGRAQGRPHVAGFPGQHAIGPHLPVWTPGDPRSGRDEVLAFSAPGWEDGSVGEKGKDEKQQMKKSSVFSNPLPHSILDPPGGSDTASHSSGTTGGEGRDLPCTL